MSDHDLVGRPIGVDRRRRATRIVMLAVCTLILAGCASATGTSGDSPPPAPQATDATQDASATPDASMSDLIGYWHRAQTCDELLAAFETAGLAESHRGWLQGNFYGGAEGPATGDPRAGAAGPLEHSHWFTATGQFGSHDEAGEQVDSGDVEFVDADTLAFPSHATEFGYDGDLLVDYALDGEVVTFEVTLPDPCDASCQDAYAWALSAFASGPWAAGDVP